MAQFSERGTRRIIDAVKRVESKPVSLVPTRHRPTKDIYPLAYVAKVTTEVTAFDGTTLGTGKAELYKSDTDYEIEGFKEDVDVYSIHDAAIVEDSWIFISPNHQGIWIVVSGSSDHVIGKLDGTLSQGGSATVSVWTGSPGAETDSGDNIVAYDWLMKSGATAIATGKKVHCARINGYWYVVNAECA